MAVAWERDRISLIYDPVFVQGLNNLQLEAVLMHEARHVIYGHCFMDADEWPHEKALLIAQEVTVNEGLHHLPCEPILLEHYSVLKPDTDTAERYSVLAAWLPPEDESSAPTPKLPARLARVGSGTTSDIEQPLDKPQPDKRDGVDGQRAPAPSDVSVKQDADGDGDGDGDGNGNGNGEGEGNGNRNRNRNRNGNGEGDGHGKGDGNGNGEGEGDGNGNGHGDGDGDGNGDRDGESNSDGDGDAHCPDAAGDGSFGSGDVDGGKAGSGKPPARSEVATSHTSPLDSHDRWEEMRRNRDQVESELRREMSEIMGSVSAIGLDAADLRNAVAVLQSRQPGWQPGSSTVGIDPRTRDINSAQLRQLLEQMSGSGRDRGARFDRPPRRSPELLGIIPAQARMRNRICALAVIDTSGSMDAPTLASIAAILRFIEDAAELTVVECDTEIHRVYPFNGSIRTVTGRGGTDFRPPLEPSFLAKMQAEAVVYFTDGYGPLPEKPPIIPVIWAITHGGKPPCAWGKVLEVEQ